MCAAFPLTSPTPFDLTRPLHGLTHLTPSAPRALCLPPTLPLPPLQLVFYGKLASSDGSVRHCGDQRSGAAAGDDEQIVLSLAHVHPAVTAIGIVVNSYSGQAQQRQQRQQRQQQQ